MTPRPGRMVRHRIAGIGQIADRQADFESS
jgi:hypothetical protein